MVKTPFRPSKALAGAIAAGLLGWGCAQVAGLDGDYESFPPVGAGQGGSGGSVNGEAGAGQGGGGSSGSGGRAGNGSSGPFAIAKPGETCLEEGSSACFDHAHTLILTCKRTPPGTGALVWTELEYCRGDDLCDSRPRSDIGVRSGTCQPGVPECLGQQPGARLCLGKTHYVCGPDLVTSDVEECGSEDLCGMTVSRNMTKCVVCEGGTFSCDGEVRRQCKNDWLGYDYIEDCAQQGLFCNVSTAACSPNRCEPGDYNCEDDELQQCVDPKQGFTHVAICQDANPVCDAVGKQCDVCRKDETRCRTVISGEKDDRELCADDGQSWLKDPCVAPNPVCRGPDGSAKCVQCTVVEDCPDRTLCNPRTCNTATSECNDNKQTGPLPATEQVANDCRLKACDDGSEVSQPDPSDAPIDADTTDCLVPTCNAAGNIVPVPRPQNSPCGPGNTGICNATGVCGTCSEGTTSCTSESQVSTCDQNGDPGPSVACTTPGPHCEGGQCFACTQNSHCGPVGECKLIECLDHVCVESNKPDGEIVNPDPVDGDCQIRVCEGGLVVNRADPSDKPDDIENDCFFPNCTDGVPGQTPFNAGGGCIVGGVAGTCDDAGTCVPNIGGEAGMGGQTAGAGGSKNQDAGSGGGG